MSDIYDEFENQLARWHSRYGKHPHQELLILSLLALEREETVAVAYREQVLRRRLTAMCLPSTVREWMALALVGVWKDEEMHARYVRHLLLQHAGPLVTARTFLQQGIGHVGGWTASVRQHRRWADAPLSRGAATALTWAGACTGRVPRHVRSRLRYLSFREFCLYNVETERTALLCWQRLTELVSDMPVPDARIDEFARIAADEERHRQIFATLGAALDDDDTMRRGVTTADLSERIANAGCGTWRQAELRSA